MTVSLSNTAAGQRSDTPNSERNRTKPNKIDRRNLAKPDLDWSKLIQIDLPNAPIFSA